jgi:oxygen-independent coproporphyrinogen-3 oxidase
VALAGPHAPVASLYIHTPFCVHKCHYCDFYSFVDTRDQQGAFVERLLGELRSLSPHAGPLRTIFVGGGTPSLLRPDLWRRVLGVLGELFDLSAIRRPWAPEHADPWRPVACGEFTVECNPESATDELMGVLREGGVNRVSVGAQSFIDRHLKTLERWHDPANVARAIDAARRAGIERRSLDLIYAIPGQTLEEWDRDLGAALAIGTTHLSCYTLTYEPNTAMTRRLSLGEFDAAPDEVEEAMFRATVARLRRAGLERYEVSNFAVPGHESRHNLAYWVQEGWLAAGPSASGHVPVGASLREGSWRFKNVPRLGDYLASEGFAPVIDVEPPDPLRLVRERVMMGLRLGAGLLVGGEGGVVTDLGTIAPALVEPLTRKAGSFARRGWLTMTPDRWTLTDEGFLVADHVAGELMDVITPDES